MVANGQIRVGEGEPLAEALDVDVHLDRVADPGRRREVGRHADRGERRRRRLGGRRAISERDVGEAQQEPAVSGAARVNVLWQHAQPDDESVALLPIKDRPDQIRNGLVRNSGAKPGGISSGFASLSMVSPIGEATDILWFVPGYDSAMRDRFMLSVAGRSNATARMLQLISSADAVDSPERDPWA